jgi:Phage capsid family
MTPLATPSKTTSATKRGEPGSTHPHDYGHPKSEVSFFRDLVVVADHEARVKAARLDPVARGRVSTTNAGPNPVYNRPAPRDALKRIRRHNAQFDLTTGSVAGSVVIPPPLAEYFMTAVNARGVVAGLLPRTSVPLGTKAQAVRMSGGTAVTPQSAENAAVTEQDSTFALVDSPVATLAGHSDCSRPLIDRSQPNILDIALAQDLGNALASKVDQELLRGTGSGGSTQGFASISGTTTLTHDDASPTQAKAIKKIFELAAAVAVADGGPATHVLLHPRRFAWLLGHGAVAQSIATSDLTFTPTPAISTVISTTQDEIFVINAPELGIAMDEPVTAHGDPGSSTLSVRFTAFQYVASLAGRRPTCIGRSNGSMWTTPAWA